MADASLTPGPAAGGQRPSHPVDAGYRTLLLGAAGVCLIAVAGYAFTIDQRGYFEDDFHYRVLVLEQGWLGAFRRYIDDYGVKGSLAVLHLLAWHRWLWDWPMIHQAFLLGMHALQCLLLFWWVRNLVRNPLRGGGQPLRGGGQPLRGGGLRAAVTAAAVFAAWHTFPSVLAWPVGGFAMLHAQVALLVSLLLYTRYLNSEERSRRGACWALSLLLFAASTLCYPQHLAMVALFSAMALLSSTAQSRVSRGDGMCRVRSADQECGKSSVLHSGPHCGPYTSALALLSPGESNRFPAVVRTVPFWVVAALVGVASVVSSEGSAGLLEPVPGSMIHGMGLVLLDFWRISVWGPLVEWSLRSGAVAAFSEFVDHDPARLVLSIATLLMGCALLLVFLRRVPRCLPTANGALTLGVAGLLTALASLAFMALRPNGGLNPRHTMLPAMGLALLLAAGFVSLRGKWRERIAAAALVTMVVGLSMFRLGHAYEYTIRTRVMKGVLDSLAAVRPAPSPDELLLIIGVRKYGRGFMNAWGLSDAYRLQHGTEVRITTVLHRRDGRLVANEPWDYYSWPVDLTSTRCFVWNESTQRLDSSSVEEYVRRHPRLNDAAGVVSGTNPAALTTDSLAYD